MATREEMLEAIGGRYRTASRREKGRILDEFVATTGCHRKQAIRALRSAKPSVRPRQVRSRLYDDAVKQALIFLWEAGDRLCSKRLKALIPILIASMERHGHLNLDPTVKDRLLQVSPASIDRLLSETRGHIDGKRRRRSGGVGVTLRRAIPVRTFNDWGDPPPGFFEVDMVEHCGGVKTGGNFVHSLVLTDIASGWTECLAMPMRSQTLIAEALDAAASDIPFPVLGIDTDNDGAFINETIFDYCNERKIAQTRSRPYRKNDQAWVEQKNGAVVRKLAGYQRFSGLAATRTFATLYKSSRLYINYFQPSFKLKSKARDGAHVVKKYYPPSTPFERLMDSPSIKTGVKEQLNREFLALDPMALLRDIRSYQKELSDIADCVETKTVDASSDVDVEAFLQGLATAWKSGEVRPTHRRKRSTERSWRTRVDPFAELWPACEQLLAEDPTLTAHDLMERLLTASPNATINSTQLRTLQRRLKTWRGDHATLLLFGHQTRTPDSLPSLPEIEQPSP